MPSRISIEHPVSRTLAVVAGLAVLVAVATVAAPLGAAQSVPIGNSVPQAGIAVVGEGIVLDTAVLDSLRPSAISFHLAKHLLYKQFRDPGQPAKMHLFYPLQRIARRWIDEG